jgi:spore germination protein
MHEILRILKTYTRTIGVTVFLAAICAGAAGFLTGVQNSDLPIPTATQTAAVITAAGVAHAQIAVPDEPEDEPEEAPIAAPPIPTIEKEIPPPASSVPTPTAPAVVPKAPISHNGVVAWLDINDWDAGVASVRTNARAIRDVSPAWYIVTPDGKVVPRPGIPVDDSRLLGVVRDQKISLHPLVMNLNGTKFDSGILRKILDNPATRSSHAAALHALVMDHGYDGLDIDYETLSAADFDVFATLVEEVAALLHGSGKTLAISIEARPDDNLLPAWKRIGAAADEVRFMAYGQKHTTPQAVVNVQTMRAHLARALSVIPADKLTHGMPDYCFSWSGGKVGSGTWNAFMRPNLSKNVQREAASQAPSYSADGKTVWCEDAVSIQKKVGAARELGITHFALWRLGGEDPQLWDISW